MKKITIRTNSKAIKTLVSLSIAATLSGCAATEVMLEHRNLDTATKMNPTLFLNPVAPQQKTVFVSIKNTSDQEMDINAPLVHAMSAKGYKVVTNPNNAHYWIQANIRQVGKMSESASKAAFGGGFGSTLASVGTGAALGSFGGNGNTMLAGGIAGGLVGMAADSLVKAVNYTMITDVQISERAGKGVQVKEQFNAYLSNGTSSNTQQVSSKTSNFHHYRTRVVSKADKVNLQFKDARPALEYGLVKSIAGIF